ncbi:hypothetical protein J7E62_29740 [Variovorax paradoxus]|nr:hypothetical protein [Variovorax paradoxus]
MLGDLSHHIDPENCTCIITWTGAIATLIRVGNIDTKPIMPSGGLRFMYRNMRFPRSRSIGNIDREAGTLSNEGL